MVTLYGISNCDTVRKTKKWLDANGVEYHFHDFRKDGLQREQLLRWAKAVGWEKLLNRRGMTWRKLDEAEKAGLDELRAIELMLNHPAMIKRPVLENGATILVGFDESRYREALGL